MADSYQPFPDITAWTSVPFDPTTYDQYAALLEQARAEATEDAREHAVRTAIRYAGTDTGAIEGLYTTDRGFTRTVAISAAGWEQAANERGPNAAQVIKDQIEAYEWLLDLVTESRPVTEHVIRELHAILCRSQDTYTVYTEVGEQTRPLPKGEYKQFPNNPTSLATGQIHHYAPPDMVAPEVHRLVTSLSSEEYRNAHPVVQAAYLHYGLVAIHPFADGNGRTTRALASVPLYRALRVPLMVLRDRRDEYLDALGRADAGDLGAFVTFVAERVREVCDLVVLTTRLGRGADRYQSLATLAAAGGAQAAEHDAAAVALLDLLRSEAEEQIGDLDLPYGVSVELLPYGGEIPVPPGHRIATPPRHTEQGLAVRAIGRDSRLGTIAVLVPAHATGNELLVVSDNDAVPPLPVPLEEVRPEIREVARIKVATWVTHLIDAELARVAAG